MSKASQALVNLSKLIYCLSKKEKIETLKGIHNSKHKTKLFILFNYLNKTPTLSIDSKILKKQLSNLTDQALRTLQFRLKKRILNVTIFEKVLKNQPTIDKSDLIYLNLKRKVLIIHFLIARNFSGNLLKTIIDSSLRQAKKTEKFFTVAELLTIKKQFYSTNFSLAQLNKIQAELEWNILAIQKLKNAFLLYENGLKSGLREFNSFQDFYNFNVSVFKELEKINNPQHSSLIKYYELAVKGKTAIDIKDFKSALNHFNQILVLIKNKPFLTKASRIGVAYHYLSASYFALKDYKSSFAYSNKSILAMQNDYENLIIAKYQKFYPTFELGNYQECLEIIHSILANPNPRFKQINSRLPYLKALIFYKTGLLKESIKILLQEFENFDDKEGWDLQERIFLIQCYIETSNLDIATFSIEALRKQIDRKEKKEKISKRTKLILKILLSLSNNGFDFKITIKNTKAKFLLLESDSTDYQWIPFTGEVIQFHKWFNGQSTIQK